MDTLKILLAATIALLLGALAVSYNKNSAPAAASADKTELVEMKRQLAEIQLEQDRLQTERERRLLEEAVAAKAAAAPAAEVAAADSAQIEAMKAEIALLQEEKDKANRDAENADKEAAFVTGKITESRDKEARRARVIKDALVMARVREWVENAELGGFAVIDIVMPENVTPDTVLCVRRNTGILGRLKVGEVTIEGGIANPIGSFGDARPEAGDELIMEPPF